MKANFLRVLKPATILNQFQSGIAIVIFMFSISASYASILKTAGTFTLTPSSKSVAYTSGSFTVTLNTTSSWTASSGASWLTLAQTSGSNGNSSKTISYSQNSNTSTRSGTITYYSQGTTRTISVTQSGTPAITISTSYLNFNNSGSSQTVSVITYNTSAAISCNNSAFAISSSSISSNTCMQLVISCSANYNSTRTGTITISGGGITKTASLSQTGGVYCTPYGEWFSQVNSTWANEIMCAPYKIGGSGCVITCLAMLHKMETSSSYPSNPSQLNSFLKSTTGGYNSACEMDWGIAADADGSGGLKYVGSGSGFTWLDNELNACRKVVLRVNNNTHSVLCIAKTSTGYKLLDPGVSGTNQSNPVVKYLAQHFGNTFSLGRSYSGSWGGGSYKSEPYEEEYNFDFASFENKVYPNPISVNGLLQYEVGSNRPQAVSIKMFDYSGKIMSDETMYFGDGVNIGSLKVPDRAGLYFVIFQFNDNTSLVKKIVVQ